MAGGLTFGPYSSVQLFRITMIDPISAGSNLIGIIVPAIHGTRLLLDDIGKIVQAPAKVTSLRDDLTSLEATLESLQAVEDEQWLFLGDKVLDHAKAVIATCDSACRIFNADLQRWTRRSQGGKLTWRDRANIGFFKESQVTAMSQQLQSCKITCANLVGIATLYVVILLKYSRPAAHAQQTQLNAPQSSLSRYPRCLDKARD